MEGALRWMEGSLGLDGWKDHLDGWKDLSLVCMLTATWNDAVAFLEGVMVDHEYSKQVHLVTVPECCRPRRRDTFVNMEGSLGRIKGSLGWMEGSLGWMEGSF